MYSLSIICTALTFGRIISAMPTGTSSSDATTTDGPSCGSTPPATQPACQPGRVVAPELITLTDESPDVAVSEPSGNTLSLVLGPQGTNQDQIALFEGIPSTAKECKFGWKQREENTKETFGTNGNALVEYRAVAVDGGPFSFADVTKLADENESSAMIDFTSWDQPGFASDEFHVGGRIDCAEQIHMHLRVSKLNGDTGGVTMEGVSEATSDSLLQGVFVEWTC